MKLLLIYTLINSLTSEHNVRHLIVDYPRYDIIEQYALKLLTNDQIVDDGKIFTEHELSIRSVGLLYNLKSGENFIRVKTRANCGVKFIVKKDDKIIDDSDAYYVVLNFDINNHGNIVDIDSYIGFTSCDNDSKNVNNKHIKINNDVRFNTDISSVNRNNKRVINHIDKLLKSEKIVWNEFVFLSNQVEASYINYFEFSEKDYKGVEVNLSVLCDLPDSGYSKHTTITEISVSMTPDGEIRYIKPIYGPKTNISCN